MEVEPPYSVGLSGDGDELWAIDEIERAFGVALDDHDAPHWYTAGDVFASLLKTLPEDAATDPLTWRRFTEALARETAIDPGLITKNSPLLLPDRGFWGGFNEKLSGCVLLLVALLLAVSIFG